SDCNVCWNLFVDIISGCTFVISCSHMHRLPLFFFRTHGTSSMNCVCCSIRNCSVKL
uniref:Ovule protein n=1 Tax=Parascaris univalens TaxID=6257 RepID=A0A915BCZ8_PARUN